MKNIVLTYMISLILATAIVLFALHYRQEPKRTGYYAYLPIRTLTPIETAAIFTANSKRKPNSSESIVTTDITDDNITILTRDYVIPVNSPNQKIPESYAGVTIQGKSFRVVRNSWEDYVCEYKVDRVTLENILGYQVSKTKISDLDKNGFSTDKISFSSKNIWLYVLLEIAVISTLFFLISQIFIKLHFLLWIPCITGLDIALIFFVLWYSPAYFDADNFFQRIIIEEIPLRFSLQLGYSLFGSLNSIPILSALLLVGYIINRSLILIKNKKSYT